jgi:putative inorganic carbon (hco3(-)) transporter
MAFATDTFREGRPHSGLNARLFSGAAAMVTGAVCAALLSAAAGMGPKADLLVLAAIVGIGLVPIISWFPGLASRLLLLLLAATLSVSIKKHLWFERGHLGGAIGVRISVTEVLIMCLLATLCAELLRDRPIRILRDPSINFVFGVYLFFATGSMLAANSPKLAFFQWLASIQAFAVFLFLLNYLNSPQRLKIFVAGLLIGLGLQASIAIVQVERPGLLDLSSLGAAEEEEDVITNGSVDLPDVDTGTTFISGEITHRPTGLLIHPNVLALYLVLTIPVAAAVWLSFPEWHFQVLALVTFALGVVALYLSLSRSGWIALGGALGIAAFLIWRWKQLAISRFKRHIVILACLALVVAVGLKTDRILSRMRDTADEALDFRRDLTVMAVRMIVDHPFLGVGLNSFVSTAEPYDATGMTRLKVYPVHNTFLLEMSETGLPGGLVFIALVFLVGKRGFQSARSCRAGAAHALALLATCGFVGFWIGDMSNFVYRIPIMTSLVWAHIALVLAIGRVCGRPSASQVVQ